MKNILVFLFFITELAFSQEIKRIETYKHGQNGMELVVRSKKETVIISTYNSKMTIRQEIARKLYAMYLQNKVFSQKTLTIDGDNAKVTGKCVIRKKNNLVVVDFYYETVQWDSGLTEIYKNNLG
jgi:hypothetical protein